MGPWRQLYKLSSLNHELSSEDCSRCAEGLIAYVEWAPLTRVRASGLIGACTYLLSVPEHRMAAATVLRELSTRKQLQVEQAWLTD